MNVCTLRLVLILGALAVGAQARAGGTIGVELVA